ncbi:Receptor protein kinase-like protein [Planoprotostelium fungivorum]|uniref:non-specific serine/threonine protein kinase n=1 Tax=Planoprotostelium fungivorum TaxID=1890364 RepID=A0A2P6NNZ1_9EUKA|nr:Receptor protein kinase-like protein [Planoprotostelium fungivorum]
MAKPSPLPVLLYLLILLFGMPQGSTSMMAAVDLFGSMQNIWTALGGPSQYWSGTKICNPADYIGVTCDSTGSWPISIKFRSSALTGTLSPSIGNLINLTSLDFFNNQLSGPIPGTIGQLTSLTYINLFNNRLSGSIPDSIGSLTSLQYLLLDNCRFNGSIPSSVGGLSSIQYFSLSSNQLTGIPDSICNLATITTLQLSNNQLSGPIPTCIGNLHALQILRLDGNQLSGPIPDSVCNLGSITTLQISNNLLSGSIPTCIGDLHLLQVFWLYRNQLSGPIPDSIGNLISLTDLQFSNNNLNGSIPSTIGSLTSLVNLMLSTNRLSGPLPDSIGNLHLLQNLQLSSNQLTGLLPSTIGSLASLQTLWLQNNMMSGPIPDSIGDASLLQQILLEYNQFDGVIPASIGKLSRLTTIRMQNNQFTGSIPQGVIDLPTLNYLDASYNLLDGTVPDRNSSLVALGGLSLNNNRLTSVGYISVTGTCSLGGNAFPCLPTLNVSTNCASSVVYLPCTTSSSTTSSSTSSTSSTTSDTSSTTSDTSSTTSDTSSTTSDTTSTTSDTSSTTSDTSSTTSDTPSTTSDTSSTTSDTSSTTSDTPSTTSDTSSTTSDTPSTTSDTSSTTSDTSSTTSDTSSTTSDTSSTTSDTSSTTSDTSSTTSDTSSTTSDTSSTTSTTSSSSTAPLMTSSTSSSSSSTSSSSSSTISSSTTNVTPTTAITDGTNVTVIIQTLYDNNTKISVQEAKNILNSTLQNNADTVQVISAVVIALLRNTSTTSFDYSTKDVSIKLQTYNTTSLMVGESISSKIDNSSVAVALPASAFSSQQQVSVSLSSVSYNPFESIYNETIYSPVIGVSVYAQGKEIDVRGVDQLINITMGSITSIPSGYEAVCQYWNETFNLWSRDGCSLVVDADVAICQCSHLTNFSIGVQLRAAATEPVIPPSQDSGSNKTKLIIIIACCSVGGLLLILIVSLLVYRKVYRYKRDDTETNLSVVVDTDGIELQKMIGEGKRGQVWKSIYKETTVVAVKKLIEGIDIDRECDVMKKQGLHHPNVVQYLGRSLRERYIVMEYMEDETLHHLLSSQPRLTMDRIFTICNDVSKGLSYITSMGMVHVSVVPSKILLSGMTVKLNCFSCIVAEASPYRSKPDLFYTAPEVIEEKRYRASGHVYNVGVLLWSMVTGSHHLYETAREGRDVKVTVDKTMDEKVSQLIVDCTKKRREERPSLKGIIERISKQEEEE